MRGALAGNEKIVEVLLLQNAQADFLNSIGESAIIHATSANCDKCLNLMFEKFNFIKLMDFKILQDQLVLAYKIAQNHDNQNVQNLISSYLNRVNQMASLVEIKEVDSSELAEENSQENFAESSAEKIEKKVEEKANPNSQETHQITSEKLPFESKKIFKFLSSNKNSIQKIKRVEPLDLIQIQKQKLPKISKPEPKLPEKITPETPRKKVYKFNGEKKSWQNLENSQLEISKKVIGLISKNSPAIAQKKVANFINSTPQKDSQLTKKVFKFASQESKITNKAKESQSQ
jgi:hypothetical protein